MINVLSFIDLPGLLAAATVDTETVTSLTYDWPRTNLGWTALVGGFTALILFALWMYKRDTRGLHWFWRGWMATLRVALILGLVVIALNPQERTRKHSFRQSRVAILVDTSLSMRHPLTEATSSAEGGASSMSRAEAIQKFLQDSALLENLQRDHEVSLYTFDSATEGPVRVFAQKDAAQQSRPTTNDENGPQLTPEEQKAVEQKFWEETLSPRGTETAFGESLIQLIEEVKGEQLAGVLAISDGSHNAGRHPDDAHDLAIQSSTRLISVGVGGTQEPKSLQIASVQSPTNVRFGDPFDLHVFVQGGGLKENTPVQVQLMMKPEGAPGDPKLIESQVARLKKDGSSGRLSFKHNPERPGVMQYMVQIQPTGNIPELRNPVKVHRMTITVDEQNTGVLIIAGGPMRDYRFLTSMLSRHPDLDIDIWLQSVLPDTVGQVSQNCDIFYSKFPTTFPKRPLKDALPNYEQLSVKELERKAKEYDVVLLFDPDWNSPGWDPSWDSKTEISDPLARLMSVHRLSRWVGNSSGGLIMVAGDIYTPELTKPGRQVKPEQLAGFKSLNDKQRRELEKFAVTDLYPVVLTSDSLLDKESEQPWPVKFTPKGRESEYLQLSETPQESADDWRNFEGVYRCYPTGGKKAGASILAEFADPRSVGDQGLPILFATQFYGSGRVFYIGSPEIWRLRALSELHFDRFWLQVIQEVGQGRRAMGSSQTVEMMEKRYVIRQMINVKARLQDPQGQPIGANDAIVHVQFPNGKRMVPPLKISRNSLPNQEKSDEYSGQFRATMSGEYRLEIVNPTENEPLVVRVQVDAPKLEDQNRQQNVPLLTNLTKETGGAYFSLSDAYDLEQKLAETRQKSEPDSENPNGETTEPSKTREKAISQLLPNRSQEYWVDKQLQTLWDRMWVLYLLVGLLGLEWLTRKLLKLA